ncbi:DUF2218 domain-containing protein [Shinella curvata]|uniref:DUF2218 domain-containing protein n=1 Tax=Shinella curvata TaxID=1817964 RepID=A0ABT8XEY8_9HYPH|nr:DUF2218 domain-containing protein [Shinella curvata]MCJ8052852.1 DUF2218 domain-containing protein [Shinella curvata]MDO6122183.1 DUF2218 domain-containing protein [Shinella curvata]
MIEATAVMKTEFASRYLVQMCKHFAHKVDVQYTDTHGECRFNGGVATFEAKADGLQLVVKAPSEEIVAWAQSAIETHLVRFAFREKIDGLVWQR